MKKILFPVLLISVSVPAQAKKELKPYVMKIDTLDRKKELRDTVRSRDGQKNLYRMPVAKPAPGTEYSSLKNTETDQTDYRMLNVLTPEQPKEEKSGAQPPSENK